MIMRIILILIIGGCILLGACQDITPGYLQTEYAGYTMDSMVVKKVLDLMSSPFCQTFKREVIPILSLKLKRKAVF